LERSTPASPPSSSGSPKPSATSSRSGGDWRLNAILFLLTVASVFYSRWMNESGDPIQRLVDAAEFTCALLGILLVHEFGHYIAARAHGVDASLPYFIPLPASLFGTMGAVIRMRSAIPTRRALLDIGASGPLAGLAVAIPLYAWGLSHSKVIDVSGDGDQLSLGTSLLLRVMEPRTAPGTDILLSPIALAGWGGMFVTMINLLPVGQLDGGHVAYALLGRRQDWIARNLHRALLAFFLVLVLAPLGEDVRDGAGLLRLGKHVQNATFWLVWFHALAIIGTLSSPVRPRAGGLTIPVRIGGVIGLGVCGGLLRSHPSTTLAVVWLAAFGILVAMDVRGGVLRPHALLDHPPTRGGPDDTLGAARTGIGVLALLALVVLFMPMPLYER